MIVLNGQLKYYIILISYPNAPMASQAGEYHEYSVSEEEYFKFVYYDHIRVNTYHNFEFREPAFLFSIPDQF
jgi:hypothetical protein